MINSKYFKSVVDGYILGVGITENGDGNIAEEEYMLITEIIHNKPIPREGYGYKLKDITYEWEEYKLPEPEEPTIDDPIDGGDTND